MSQKRFPNRDEIAAVRAEANRLEPGAQDRVFRVDLQPDDVNRGPFPSHRNLDAVDEANALRLGFCARLGEPRHSVVIGQREYLDAVRRGPRDELFRLEQTVGSGRVTMQVDVQWAILPEKLLDHRREPLGLVVMQHVTRFGNDALGQPLKASLARSEILRR